MTFFLARRRNLTLGHIPSQQLGQLKSRHSNTAVVDDGRIRMPCPNGLVLDGRSGGVDCRPSDNELSALPARPTKNCGVEIQLRR